MDADQVANQFFQRLERDRWRYARVPLFVLGAGISYPPPANVKLLKGIAEDLLKGLREVPVTGASVRATIERLCEDGDAIVAAKANRLQAAEFFLSLQRPQDPYEKIWEGFSRSFVRELWEANPTQAHKGLAGLLRQGEAYTISLNFDSLTLRALRAGGSAILLQSKEDVETYFTGLAQEFTPAVMKVRGDVFYAKCTNGQCPQSRIAHPLPDETLRKQQSDLSSGGNGPESNPSRQTACQPSLPIISEEAWSSSPRMSGAAAREWPICPLCGEKTLRLQFSFPGHSEKEEAASPILWCMRRFLAQRISAIVLVGLSGRWDQGLLEFFCDLASERRLVLVDVKPPDKATGRIVESYVKLYHPSICEGEMISRVSSDRKACFARIEESADSFFGRFSRWGQTNLFKLAPGVGKGDS